MSKPALPLTVPSTHRLYNQLFRIGFAIAFSASAALALPSDPLRYQGGVRNSPGPNSLTKKQQDSVIQSLRQKTGLLELEFDEDGFLRIGDHRRLAGGSPTARHLVSGAIEGDMAFDLEAYRLSELITFGRLGSPISYQSLSTGSRIEVVPLELDFTDFEMLRGDKRVILSFDLGMVVLHELAHGVLRLPDVQDHRDGLGACETHINQIRRELNLPERNSYFARLVERPGATGGKTMRSAELLFTRLTPTDGGAKRELFVLTWDALRVGQVRNDLAIGKKNSRTIAMQVTHLRIA